MHAYTQYEKMSLREARAAFQDPFRTPISALVHVVERDARDAKALGRTVLQRGMSRLARVLQGALDAGFRGVFRTLNARAVYGGFRGEGVRVRRAQDVARLELWEVDEVAERLPPRYIAASVAVGVLSGSLGRVGALVDGALVVGLAARAIGDYALHYGFDPRAPSERRFARDVLVAALTPAHSVRAASIDELVAAGLAAARAWRRREVGLGAPALLRIAQHVFSRGLTRGQRASVARVGSVVAAAVNAWLLLGVMRAARSAYRERFLAGRKLGVR
jgi:EcsC protein family